MGWPQITIIVLGAMSVGLHLAKDGQPRTGKYSFFLSAFTVGTEMYVLHAGGFFS